MSELVVTIDKEKFYINTDHNKSVIVNGVEHEIDIYQLSAHTYKIKLTNKIFHITCNKLENNKYSFLIDGHYFESFVRTKLEDEAAKILNNNFSNENKKSVKSPMPGLILKINRNVGDKINVGDPLILLEAMKMENEIKSPCKGIISKILVQKDNSVEKNQILIILK